MLFKSNGKFIDDITDSFNRFGIETKLAEKGSSKNTQKFEMYDSIHDSGYVAVAVDKPVGKNTEEEWNNIINNDLLPTLTNKNYADTNPASALIVPSKDIDKVEKLLINKGLSPSVYQLFPGYVVAGINKKDTSKLINEYKNNQEKNKEEEQTKPIQKEQTQKKDNKPKEESKEANKVENIEQRKKDLLNDLSNIDNKKVNTKKQEPSKKENSKQENKIENNNIKNPKPSSTMKKIATAALLGTAIGAGVAAYPTVKDNINNYLTPHNEKVEQAVLDNATKDYFEKLKNGYEQDDELLKIISENPQLAEQYINELANTPIQTSALKNPSVTPELLREKAASNDETVRSAVAENPNTPKDILEHLAKDKSNKVLKSLAKNPSISQDMMEDLSNYSGLHSDMMENPAITPEIMRKITAGKNRDCEFNKKYMSNPCISIDELLYNLNNPDECVRQGIALNPNTPTNAIKQLANDKNPLVKNSAYKHSNMSVDELNKLFPENWVPENNNPVKESARIAALENPNISPNIRKKAVFMDPARYSKTVASNKNISPELINRMKNMAQGKKGVNNLIAEVDNIKNNPSQLKKLKAEMDAKQEPLEKPLRRLMNKQFIDNVYDPYELIENMRQMPSSNKKYNLKNDKKDNNGNNQQGEYKNIVPAQYNKATILDKNGNPPDYFSNSPLPPLNPSDVSYNPDAEKAALKVADNIIKDLMNDSIPDIEKTLKSSSYIPNTGNSGNNKGNNQGNVGKNNSGSNIINKFGNNIDDKYYKTYENACKKIDELHKMF